MLLVNRRAKGRYQSWLISVAPSSSHLSFTADKSIHQICIVWLLWSMGEKPKNQHFLIYIHLRINHLNIQCLTQVGDVFPSWMSASWARLRRHNRLQKRTHYSTSLIKTQVYVTFSTITPSTTFHLGMNKCAPWLNPVNSERLWALHFWKRPNPTLSPFPFIPPLEEKKLQAVIMKKDTELSKQEVVSLTCNFLLSFYTVNASNERKYLCLSVISVLPSPLLMVLWEPTDFSICEGQEHHHEVVHRWRKRKDE